MAVEERTKEALTPDHRELQGAEEQAAAYAPVIANVPLTIANTQYPYQFPAEVKGFTFHCRTSFAIRYAYREGLVADSQPPYFTLKANTAKSQDDLKSRGALRIYFASAEAAVVVEIESWG